MQVYKKSESLLMKTINVLLLIVTFGQQNKFMNSYITTIGSKVYVPDDWDQHEDWAKDVILYHESIHVEQFKREGILFSLKYLFWPLPLLHAHARLEYELEAYSKEIVYSYRKYGTPVFGADYDNIVAQMTGPMYAWTCLNRKHVATRLTARILEEMKATRPANETRTS